MSRKTHRFSLMALAGTAIVTFAGLESSGANAQVAAAEAKFISAAETAVLTDETVPVAPATEFVAEPVIQPLPERSEAAAEPAPSPATPTRQAGSLRALVERNAQIGRLSPEMECLAGAVYFEARGEPLEGQLAVAQVVVNRSKSRLFPGSYCGVVYQPSQFSFVRGGRMPALERSSAAWRRATAIATIAHDGLWDSEARDSLYFHARYVTPGWSRTKIARATIDTHVFYR